MNRIFVIIFCFFCSCSVQNKIQKKAAVLIKDTLLQNGFCGISIYDVAEEKFVFNYNADKYFVPASNIKLFTLYAALTYLPDTLKGIEVYETENAFFFSSTGDPTFLHASFLKQPLFEFLKSTTKPLYMLPANQAFEKWGNGWSWDDFGYSFMPERSSFPMYGNVLSIRNDSILIPYFRDSVVTSSTDTLYSLKRNFNHNHFIFNSGKGPSKLMSVPFITSEILSGKLLADTLHKNISLLSVYPDTISIKKYIIHSQLRDSVLKLMMHESDNFIAEQLMLMISKQLSGKMSDVILDSILKSNFQDAPQKIKWKDASGLSRYNQSTPQDFIYILKKLRYDFTMDRINNILPAGNEGTLKNYFITEGAAIHAKTGSMSNVVCLSGYLRNKKNKLLLFSVLTNNIPGPATNIRKKVEIFLKDIREL